MIVSLPYGKHEGIHLCAEDCVVEVLLWYFPKHEAFNLVNWLSLCFLRKKQEHLLR